MSEYLRRGVSPTKDEVHRALKGLDKGLYIQSKKTQKSLASVFSLIEYIKREYLKLLEETEWTQQVYQSHFNFEPIVGEIYHLYLSRKEKPFLSLISPEQWNKPHLGSFRLETGRKWIKI